MATIFNEGRVVGLSAYESYVRQAKTQQVPEEDIVSEKEWLLDMIASGRSLLLKVPEVVAGDESVYQVIKINFPTGCNLFPISNIHADFFIGDAHVVGSELWGRWITDYGDLIDNSGSIPTGSATAASALPAVSQAALSDDMKLCLTNYAKIVDGVVVTSGTWASTNTTPPADNHPNVNQATELRLLVKGSIDAQHRPLVLLTGFTKNSLVAGVADTGGSVNKTEWANGAYLGPYYVPWASKVLFNLPSAYTQVAGSGSTTSAALTGHNTFTLLTQGQDPGDLWTEVQSTGIVNGRFVVFPSAYIDIQERAQAAYARFVITPGRQYRVQTIINTHVEVDNYRAYPVYAGTFDETTGRMNPCRNPGSSLPDGSAVIEFTADVGEVIMYVNNFDTTELPIKVWVKEN